MAVQKLFPSELHTQVTKAQVVLDEVSLSLIRKRQRQRQREEEENHSQKSGAEKLEVQRIPNDFLDLLFDARDKTTGQALTEVEVLSLFLPHFARGNNILCFVFFITLSLSQLGKCRSETRPIHSFLQATRLQVRNQSKPTLLLCARALILFFFFFLRADFISTSYLYI